MPDKNHALRSILIALLLSGIAVGVTSSAEPAPADQTLEAIQDCMAHSLAPWPDERKQEYLETIRSAVELHQDAPHYAVRLEILRKGFAPYWQSFKKTQDRSLFEVHRTRIRWYTEHLMGTKFPSEEERQTLRDQYTDIWDYAVDSLLRQFPFLDPNTVQAAKADDLRVCHSKIDAPLLPVYLRPLSEEQVGQIKQRWHNLRYARVDLWRRLGGGSMMPSVNGDTTISEAERHYQLTKESLSQLLAQIWMVVPQRPDYYLSALENRSNALKRRLQLKRQARSDQQRLEKERSRQLLQTEHISFLLAALLEAPGSVDGSASARAQEQTPLEQKDKTAKGGDAYEVDNNSPKK